MFLLFFRINYDTILSHPFETYVRISGAFSYCVVVLYKNCLLQSMVRKWKITKTMKFSCVRNPKNHLIFRRQENLHF